MIVELTDRAIKRIVEQTKGNQFPGIRLGVTGGGCTGYKYLIEPITEYNDEDEVVVYDGFAVMIDQLSVDYLNGSTLDYVKEGINQYLKLYNPNETGACGCGVSITF